MFLTQEARKATSRCDRRMQRAELRCAGEKVFVRLPGKAEMKRHVIETQMADADEGSVNDGVGNVKNDASDVNNNAVDANNYAGDVHNDAGDVNNDTGDADNDACDVHNDSRDYHDNANDVYDNAGVIDGDVGDVDDITQPFLNNDVLELIIKITLSTFSLMRNSLKRVSRFLKVTVDNVPCPRMYIPELPEEQVVISIPKIIMVQGKCSGAVAELREAIKSPRWHQAWIKLVALEYGWFTIDGIYWKNRLI